jgi:hypothetical protein
MIASFDLEAQPVDSALLRVFGVAAAGCEMALPGRVLYEIDDQGKIIAYVTLFEYEGEKIYTKTPTQDDSRFVIEDNCLELTGEGQSESPGPIDVPITSPGICGAGAQTAFAVDRDGPVFGTPTGDYVCVQGDVDYACRDCWEEGGSWFSVDALAGSYTSLGSLDGVSVSAWAMVCNEPDVPVDIHAGDSAVYEMATTIEYRQSPSPEELGYEAFEIPVFP